MKQINESRLKLKLATILPIASWLPKYQKGFIKWDLIAGVTLAFFMLPVSMAYATLAGIPTYFGIYCCLVGGLIFALFTTSKHVAIGPTSSISLMIGSTVAVISGGDPVKWAAIAALTAFVVGIISLLAFAFKLSSLINFISDNILLGFKAGAALSMMSTQLPKFFGLKGGGDNIFSTLGNLVPQLSNTNWVVFSFGLVALGILILGDIFFPGKPVSLFVVVASIIVLSVTDLASAGVHVTGPIPNALPSITIPSLRLRDIDGIIPLAFACFLMGYIETVSAARTFALKNNYSVNTRQELLSLGAANLATAFSSGYVVAGGLSQSLVNEKSGARSPMSLIICSVTLAFVLLFLAGFLKNLPEVVLAAVVLHAVSGLIKIKELKRIYSLNKQEFLVAMIALSGVLVLGILKGVMLAVVMSLVLLIRRLANPVVPVLGRVGQTRQYSDISRHPDNIIHEGISIQRIESPILYFNTNNIQEKILSNLDGCVSKTKLLILDLSAVPGVDIAGSEMFVQLFRQLHKEGISIRIAGALSNVRDLLRKMQLEEQTGHISRTASINELVEEYGTGGMKLVNQ